MKKEHKYAFISKEEGRVDSVATQTLNIPRSSFSNETMKIIVNGKSVKKSYKLNVEDKVEIEYTEEVLSGLEAEDIPLSIIYEDDDILVLDKEQGMIVHPGSGNNSGTIVNALLSRFGEDFSTSDDDTRPGIVHRLDKDTSGVMIIAKNRDAQKELSEQFSEHTNEKYYTAIAKGFFIEKEGLIDKRITRDKKDRKKFTVTNNKSEGKDALTRYRVLSQNDNYALLKLRIYTGRTHQIRVHLLSSGHPVLGDPIYSRKDKKYEGATLMLHASKIVINHPRTKEKMIFYSPLPPRFLSIIEEENLKKDEE